MTNPMTNEEKPCSEIEGSTMCVNGTRSTYGVDSYTYPCPDCTQPSDVAGALKAFKRQADLIQLAFAEKDKDQRKALWARVEVSAINLQNIHGETIRAALNNPPVCVGGEVWRQDTPPMDGTAFYARYEAPFRWLPYKPASGQFKSGIKGRWQMMNDYGGWENTENEPTEWRPHENDR